MRWALLLHEAEGAFLHRLSAAGAHKRLYMSSRINRALSSIKNATTEQRERVREVMQDALQEGAAMKIEVKSLPLLIHFLIKKQRAFTKF